MFTFKHLFLLNFHCLTYSALSKQKSDVSQYALYHPGKPTQCCYATALFCKLRESYYHHNLCHLISHHHHHTLSHPYHHHHHSHHHHDHSHYGNCLFHFQPQLLSRPLMCASVGSAEDVPGIGPMRIFQKSNEICN